MLGGEGEQSGSREASTVFLLRTGGSVSIYGGLDGGMGGYGGGGRGEKQVDPSVGPQELKPTGLSK